MSETLKKERDFTVPGDEVVKSMEFLPGRNTFREGDSIFSKRLGLVHIENRVISVVPLSGTYMPQAGDMTIGEVVDIQSNGWIVNIDAAHDAYLPLSGIQQFIRQGSDLSKVYNIGDILYSKVLVANGNSLSLTHQDTRARKLVGGKLFEISPVKVPRLIGKQGSMISLIKDKTECNIYVGQNGIVWIFGKNTDLVAEVIKKIEKESHLEGLTDSIEKFLVEKTQEVKSSDEKSNNLNEELKN